MSHDIQVRIGGAAGDGIESSGSGFCTAITRGGRYVFGLPDYYSRIRGGHNFYTIRISDRPLHSHTEQVHVLLALTTETVSRHREHMVGGGVVAYDTALQIAPEELNDERLTFVGLPMSQVAEEKAGTVLARNTLALGFAAGLIGYDIAPLEGIVRENFARKGQAIVDGNLDALGWGYQQGQEHAPDFAYPIPSLPDAPQRAVLDGTAAFAMGALAGGCRFVSGYPMTPGSPVLHWMAAHAAEYGVVIKHTEDEIAGITMALGAAHVGARSLVATSGGGFSLMVEGLGMAGMTETPVVIYNAQRPGPATGLPTRNEQGDLLFTIHASQGEFPRFVLAPGSHEQAFVAGWRAFNLAEKYQTPALVLSDHYLAVAVRTIEMADLDFAAVTIDRGALLGQQELDALDEPYRRFRITPTGISPRAVPGHPHAVWVTTANEHDERGAISEEAAVRAAQVEKRMHKRTGMAAEMSAPARYGPAAAPTTYVCWGSTLGPLREAIDRLNAARPGSANMLHMLDIWPFPAAAREAILGLRRMVTVEVNATGQLETLIRAQTGRAADAHIRRYDGRSMTPEYILERTGSVER